MIFDDILSQDCGARRLDSRQEKTDAGNGVDGPKQKDKRSMK